jgi:hypothetical protein
MQVIIALSKRTIIWLASFGFVFALPNLCSAQLGIWTSSGELANIPMSGPAWDKMKNAADLVDPNMATVSDQDSDNNVGILAAGIVHARSGIQSHKDKVIAALEILVAGGQPAGNTLAWAREAGAYVMAADLVGYRTTAFESWCRNMAEVWVATDSRTLLEMFKHRPNNWGARAFGSLAAIYVYLGDSSRLNEIRNYWIQALTGPPPPEISYDSDLSWHVDENNPRLINPQGSVKNGLNIDGVIPDDMRRGGSFSDPPGYTGYPWGHLQGLVMAARILDRAGMSIWAIDNSAIYRAANCLQVRYEQAYGGWAASGDDEWLMPFLDEAYGTNWTAAYDPVASEVWEHGKNAGWGYVTLDGSGSGTPPADPSGLAASDASSSEIDLAWADNASDELGFRIERSTDGGATFSEIALVGANTTNYTDAGLSAMTSYCYRVRAYNGAGTSGYSNTACATTQQSGPVEDVANGEINVAGTVNGSYFNTHSSNGIYESIEERESGGKPNNRYSYLEHKWTINVTSGTFLTFNVEAYKSASSDGDDFVFAYSTNDAAYTDMLTVTKTTDDNSYQTYVLPSSLTGTVYIRVRDTNQTAGNKALDRIYIDHLYIRSETGQTTTPAAPSALAANAASANEIDLAWTDNAADELGFKIERSLDDGNSFAEIAQVGANVTNYTDAGLSAQTSYCYRVRSYNAAGNSGYSNTDCATTQQPGPADDLASGETSVVGTVTGSYSNTHASDGVYESIEERESGGKLSTRYSYLEHKWTFNVTGGASVTFNLEAHKSASSDGDDFIFAYSTNDAAYTDMLTVTKTSDDNTYQTYALPNSLSGTVYIRVRDTNQTAGNRSLDRIYVDHIYIHSGSGVGKHSASDADTKIVVAVPNEIELRQNYPNPFNPATVIHYRMPINSFVRLAIYSVSGQLVRELVSGEMPAGQHSVVWDGTDDRGVRVASGVYLYRMVAGDPSAGSGQVFVSQRKLVLMK